jgi:glycosyltransferase involved in cell wall biosynthesis
MKKKIIFSAINVTSGGPLTILQKFMEFASANLATDYEVWFLIKSRSYLTKTFSGIHLMEFHNSQRSVFHKLYFEYFYFRKLSRKKKPYLWFSLNDCSPNVEAEIRAVYIHNATPFYEFSGLDFRFPSRVLLQKFYYKFFLRKNLNQNSFVVVQQQFMKHFVVDRLGFKDVDKVLINRPDFSIDPTSILGLDPKDVMGSSVYMIYPAKAEVYKNVHRLIDAVIMLIEQESFSDFTLWLTLNGRENAYSKYLARKAENFPQIVFKGHLSFPVLMGHLQASDIMVFPSKLETWGLPLSEATHFNKWIVVSDLPYARETLMNYRKVLYFDVDSTEDLMEKIKDAAGRAKRADDCNDAPGQHQYPNSYSLSQLFETMLDSN